MHFIISFRPSGVIGSGAKRGTKSLFCALRLVSASVLPRCGGLWEVKYIERIINVKGAGDRDNTSATIVFL